MCGIFGAFSKSPKPLHKLCSRVIPIVQTHGDKSWGTSGYDSKTREYIVCRGLGLYNPNENPHMDILDRQIISLLIHGRQPSRGAVTMENCHPFISEDGQFSLIHNGTVGDIILANPQNHTIKGDTDSELLLHRFEEIFAIEGDIGKAAQALYNEYNTSWLNTIIQHGKYATIICDSRLYKVRDADVLMVANFDFTVDNQNATSMRRGIYVVHDNEFIERLDVKIATIADWRHEWRLEHARTTGQRYIN